MKKYDARFHLPNGEEISNAHGIGNYSFKKTAENTYVLDINNSFKQINISFTSKLPDDVKYYNCGAASVREMYENEEMEKRLRKTFVAFDENEINLSTNAFPSELRISDSRVAYDPTEPGDLEFKLELIFGTTKSNLTKAFSFTILHNGSYQFTNLN